jgi:MFS family permease
MAALSEFVVFPGITAADAVMWSAFLVAFLVGGFVLFVHAYATDSMRRRIEAAGFLAFGAVTIGGLVSLLVGSVTLLDPVRGMSPTLQGYEMWLGVSVIFVGVLAWILLVIMVAFEVQDRIHIHSFVAVWEKEVGCGLISALTDDALEDGRHEWGKMGFLSRMFIFSYSYPISAVYKIFDSLIEDKSGIDEKVKLRFPNHPKEIMVPKPIAEKLIPITVAQICSRCSSRACRRDERAHPFRQIQVPPRFHHHRITEPGIY